MFSKRRFARQRGLTIIELVMFMVIVGVAAAGIIGLLNLGTKSSADPLRRKQAMLIAEAYMEEVQSARFTYCVPDDPAATTATQPTDCTTPVAVGQAAGTARPYGNVADYAAALGTPKTSFATNGIDTDVAGNALGAALASITTTVTLNVLNTAAQALGPSAGAAMQSTPTNLTVLRITIRTTYGTGPNDFVQLDGYRTRYAPTYVP